MEDGQEGWLKGAMYEAEASGTRRIHVRSQRKSLPGCMGFGLGFLTCELGVTIVLPS